MHMHLPLGLTLALAMGQAAAHDDEVVEGDAGASDGRGRHARAAEESSHDRARRAMRNGEILTISEILDRVRSHAPGRVLDTELEHEHGRWIYEIKFLDPEGRLYELEVDARNGEILRRWEGR